MLKWWGVRWGVRFVCIFSGKVDLFSRGRTVRCLSKLGGSWRNLSEGRKMRIDSRLKWSNRRVKRKVHWKEI